MREAVRTVINWFCSFFTDFEQILSFSDLLTVYAPACESVCSVCSYTYHMNLKVRHVCVHVCLWIAHQCLYEVWHRHIHFLPQQISLFSLSFSSFLRLHPFNLSFSVFLSLSLLNSPTDSSGILNAVRNRCYSEASAELSAFDPCRNQNHLTVPLRLMPCFLHGGLTFTYPYCIKYRHDNTYTLHLHFTHSADELDEQVRLLYLAHWNTSTHFPREGLTVRKRWNDLSIKWLVNWQWFTAIYLWSHFSRQIRNFSVSPLLRLCFFCLSQSMRVHIFRFFRECQVQGSRWPTFDGYHV